jgi:hypothetical protein
MGIGTEKDSQQGERNLIDTLKYMQSFSIQTFSVNLSHQH